MKISNILSVGLLLVVAVPSAPAQAVQLPPMDQNPLLRVEPGGPMSLVTSLAFSPNGQTLYAAGWDKVVRCWAQNARTKQWEPRPAFRVPLGPGADGKINALALSGDGNWLAVAGSGVIRTRAGFRERGVVLPVLAMDPAMRQDQGAIYVFDTRNRAVRILRGHQGPVTSLAFAPAAKGAKGPPTLVSAARQFVDRTNTNSGAVWVWDVARGTHRAWPGKLPDPLQMRRPGLAAWHSGNKADQLRVAVAWEDGTFRLWDTGPGQGKTSQKPDGKFNVTVAHLPGGKLLTGGVRKRGGYLQVWTAAAGQPPRKDRTIPNPPDPKAAYRPVALALAASRPGGKPDLAAVVVQVRKDGNQQTRLHLIDLGRRRFGNLRADLALWKQDESLPTLAAAGRFLAVAGGPGHAIRLFAVKDLLGNRGAALRLVGTGTTWRSVVFVKNKARLGLALGRTAKAKLGTTPQALTNKDLIFSFTQPGLTGRGGWKIDAPGAAGWKAVHRKVTFVNRPEEHSFEIRRGQRLVGRLKLKPNQVVTDFALLPPRPPLRKPILAVAFQEYGEPSLLLYDAATGDPLRHYSGHDAVIRSVAFSSDGRLLASAADDQTVCVWSLTDLGRTVGKHGLIDGLAVKNGANATVVVARVEKGSPAAGKLATGDVVEGIVGAAGKLQALTVARAYYRAVWETRPGAVLRLRVKGKGVVALTVGQGIDERKPLFSLFVTRGARRADRDWVGWNPLGPYETSTPRADRHLGWHLNTGRAAAPTAFVSFAHAAKYRTRYFRRGILKLLVRAGDPARVPPRPVKRLPPPKTFVLVGDVPLDPARADAQGRIPVQTADRTLRFAVSGFPRDQIAAALWQLDGAQPQPFDPAAGRMWSVELPKAKWTRGSHTLRVLLRTREDKPREFVAERTVRFQPPPPAVKTTLQRRSVVKKSAFMLTAVIRPTLPGQQVGVTILLNKARHKRLTVKGKELAIKETLELKAEDNLIQIVAVNRGALKGYEKEETTPLSLEVSYKPVKPQVDLEAVVPLLGRGIEDAAVPVQPGAAVVVNVPRVRIEGSITALENLTRATRDGKPLAKFQAGRKKTFTVSEEVVLRKPGLQKITFGAATKGAKAAQKILELDYRPPLPRLVYLPERELDYYDDGQGAPAVALKFRLVPRAAAPQGENLQAAARVNGKALPAKQVVLDAKKRLLTVTFTPAPGKNRVQVRLTNAWKGAENAVPLDVRFLRPPRAIKFVDAPRRSTKPVIDLTANVQSPLPLPKGAVRATVNGRPSAAAAAVKQIKGAAWEVKLTGVPLDGKKGSKNKIRLWVSNTDGESRKAAVRTVVFTGPPPPRPQVTILEPGNVTVTDPEQTVRIRVRSPRLLRRLALVRQGGPRGQRLDVSGLKSARNLKVALRLVPHQVKGSVDVARLKRDDEGFRSGELGLTLRPGLNRLRVEAITKDGVSGRSATVIINLVPPPVRLVLDRLRPLQGEKEVGKAVAAEVTPGGKFVRAAPRGLLRLYGRVVWDKARDERLRAVKWLRIRVNGVQQVPQVRLRKPDQADPRTRAFGVVILLNQAKGNRIDLDLPDLEEEDGSRRTYQVDCARPLKEKRFVHLLTVGVGEKSKVKLKARVLKALGAKAVSGQQFKLPSFRQGRLYGPLIGNVDPDEVDLQLTLMKSKIDMAARDGPANNVVLVYYHGEEVVARGGHFFRTSSRTADPELQKSYRIRCRELEKRLANTLGAKILLLDVERDPAAKKVKDQDMVENWPADSVVAVLRYAQIGKGGFQSSESLIRAWEEAKARANKLKAMEDQMQLLARRFNVRLRKRQKTLVYAWFIPDSLEGLIIGPAL
jgi:WD40 repeat protein